MDYHEIRKKLAASVANVSGILVVYDHVPDDLTPPCAVVIPTNQAITYHDTMGAAGSRMSVCRFEITVVAQRFQSEAAQELLDDFAVSVPAQLESDQTLGGEAEIVQVTEMRNYGPIVYGSTTFLALQLQTEVYTR
tara:strand:- start:1481 stop:1888 length:408 start_codon:yes stop_codon:yes gene_type:complete